MITGSLVAVLSGAQKEIRVNASQCLRMRYDENKCNECLAVCKRDAIRLHPDLAVDHNNCTGCMLCAGRCPADALGTVSGQTEISELISRLNGHPRPVLGCTAATGVSAHQKTKCLGWLSEEYLMALFDGLSGTLQLNMTACKDCVNGFVVGELEDRLTAVEAKTGCGIRDRILVVEETGALCFEPPIQTRRGFLQSFRRGSVARINNLLTDDTGDADTVNHRDKYLPLKRTVLNALAAKSGKISRGSLLQHYFYDLEISSRCDVCQECEAMCPTGALECSDEDGAEKMTFDAKKCFGCNLCAEFCDADCITVTTGLPDTGIITRKVVAPVRPVSTENN